MELEQLRDLLPPWTRVSHPDRGTGSVEGVGILRGGLVVYVHWDAPKFHGDTGDPVPWHETRIASELIAAPA